MYCFIGIYFLGFCWSMDALSISKGMGPPGTIELSIVSACEEKTDLITFDANLKTIDSKGTKALYGKANSKIAIDDTITYRLDLHKWENSGWNLQLHHEGKICQDVFVYGPQLWEKFRKVTKPDIPARCPLEPNLFVVDKLQAITSDFNIPTIFYGKMRVELKLFNKDKKLAGCLILEGNSQAPF